MRLREILREGVHTVPTYEVGTSMKEGLREQGKYYGGLEGTGENGEKCSR
jgi:hypothetical protein